ncbi:MAG: hypothetical protein WCF12_00755 [Propionicimonas sp.]
MSAQHQKKQQPRRDVFTAFPASDYGNLIVRYPDANDGRLAASYAEAANRLAGTFRGQAPDDALLLPFLFLYRHAIELELKYAIRYAVRLRRNEGETDPSLESDALDQHLKGKLKHRLMALVGEIDKHLLALNLETVPPKVRKTLELIHSTDLVGESFRYPGSLADEQDQIDFVALATAIHDAYQTVATEVDMLSVIEDYQYDAGEEQRAFEAELRGDFEGDI